MPLLLVALLAGCDQVTAPHALKIADDAEQGLWDHLAPNAVGHLVTSDGYFDVWKRIGSESNIVVWTDRGTDALDAAVIERVFVPPRGQGAPISRRTIVAWPKNASYGILGFTEAHNDSSEAMAEIGPDDALHPRSLVTVPHPNDDDWWIPRSGLVSIEPLESGGTCPFTRSDADVLTDSSSIVTCNVASYVVHLEGELVRRADARNSLLPESMRQHHRLLVGSQHVKGIRFTVRCDPKALTVVWGGVINACNGSPLAFWRSNALFAPSLGVDVTQMTSAHSGAMLYGRTVRAGNEKSRDGSGMIHWTLSDPDGTVMERGAMADNTSAPLDKSWLDDCATGISYGGRRQCLVPEVALPTLRSRYRVLVLDMEDTPR